MDIHIQLVWFINFDIGNLIQISYIYTYLEKRRGNVRKDKWQSGPCPDLSPIESAKV